MYPRDVNIDEMKAAAEGGDSKAAFNLGWYYYVGNGLVRDKAAAWKWYSMAASQGMREAAEIRNILEAEARRDMELEALKETIRSPRRLSVAWLFLICIALASIGSIILLFHVLRGQSNVGKADSTSNGKIARVDSRPEAVGQPPSNPPKETTPTRVEPRPEEASGASVAENNAIGVPTKQRNSDSVVAEVNVPPSQTVGSKRASERRTDFNDWAERARRWLEDDSDPYSRDSRSGSPDQQ